METRHDREEARVHAADISAIVSAVGDLDAFKSKFVVQFHSDAALGVKVLRIFDHLFRATTGPGFLVYEESLAANLPPIGEATTRIHEELERIHGLVQRILPQPRFFSLAAAIDDVCNYDGNPGLCESFLASLHAARVLVSSPVALQLIPAEAFGGAYASSEMLIATADQAIGHLTGAERHLLQAYLKQRTLVSLAQSPMGATYGDVFR